MIYFFKFFFTLSILCNMHNAILGRKYGYAADNQFPYSVGIRFNGEPKKVFCGGAIINERFVLTAANCVAEYKKLQSNLTILTGNHNKVEYRVKKIIIHEDYLEKKSKSEVLYDIALLKTQTAFHFNKGVLPIKIASETIPMHSTVIAIGYGITNDKSDGYPSNCLQYVQMKVGHNLVCHKYYKYNTGLLCLWQGNVTDTSCSSWASGGPVVYHTLQGIKLVGITSFNGSYSGSCKPDRFVSVLYFAEWIFNKISE